MSRLNSIRRAETVEENPVDFKKAFIAAAVASVASLLLIMLISLLISAAVLPEEIIPSVSVIVTVAGSFFAGYLTVLSVRSHGLLNGMAAGLFYFVIAFIASSVAAPAIALNKRFLINLILSVITAGVGGVICINARAGRRAAKRRRKRYNR